MKIFRSIFVVLSMGISFSILAENGIEQGEEVFDKKHKIENKKEIRNEDHGDEHKPSDEHEEISSDDLKTKALKALKNILNDNKRFTKKHTDQCFEPFLKSQKPRVTLVMCSDSRIQTYALDDTPDNDLFVIRNIGNQISTSDGSIEYGVRHLNTSLLFILGHTGCGAVKATLTGIEKLEPAIKKELQSLKLSKKNVKHLTDDMWFEGVKENVNNQVNFAMKKYLKELKENKLMIVGGVYDLHNILGKKNAKVHIININGNTNIKKIQDMYDFLE